MKLLLLSSQVNGNQQGMVNFVPDYNLVLESLHRLRQKIYDHKIVETIFAEEIDEIVVITVKVYYHN